MVAKGTGGVICDPEPHVMNVDIDMEWVKDHNESVSKLREIHPNWETLLQDIGKRLVKEIIENNPRTLRFYKDLRGKAGGNENFRIRFTMDEEAFFLPVEAIFEPEYQKKDDFWMLKAPICRRVRVQAAQEIWPLFEDDHGRLSNKKINCLIIEADVKGYNSEVNTVLENLENVKQEAEALKGFLEKNKEEFHIGEIQCLPDGEMECSRENVKKILTSGRRWDLVHYAGHSFLKKPDDKNPKGLGYVFLHGDRISDAVNIELFAQWLRCAKTRLIFLSSCKSSEVQFVQKLAKIGVASAWGFRWDIQDADAAEHASIFYENLFAERSLEYAFLKTRQEVREKKPEQIIWAAPVLVMQTRK